MEEGAGGEWTPEVELHLCIARALQKLPQLRQRALADTLPSPSTARKNEGEALHKKNESDDGEDEVEEDEDEEEEEGKAKEAVLSEVELEVELEENGEEAELTKGQQEDDFFAELADLEEEWKRETSRMAKRFCDLRHSCQRWKERERERLKKQARLEMSSSPPPAAPPRLSPASALDLFIEALLSLREEKSAKVNGQAQERETKSDRKENSRRTKAKKRTKATKPESEGEDIPRLKWASASLTDEPSDEPKDYSRLTSSESPRSHKALSSSERQTKAVSFVSAADLKKKTQPDDQDHSNVDRRHRRRSVEEQDLPSHKKNKKNKKNKQKGGSFREKDSKPPQSAKRGSEDVHAHSEDKINSPQEDKEKERVQIDYVEDEDVLSIHSNTTLYNSEPEESDSDFDGMDDDDDDIWESEDIAEQQDLLLSDQVLRGIVGLVGKRGVKPVLCEVGGHNLNCCNLLLQGSSKLEEPIIEKKGPAKDLLMEGSNVPSAFNILLSPQRNPSDVLELAADSDSDMQRWLAFFRSIYTNDGGPSVIQGFLWLRMSSRKMRLTPGSWTGITNISNLSNLTDLAVATKWQWQRYYCLCEPTRFEWFALSYVKVLPLHSVIQVQTSVIEPTKSIKFTSKRNSKSAFIGWGEENEKVVLDPRYYRYKISLIKTNSKEFFTFLTSSVDEMNSWNKAIVSHQRHHDSSRFGSGGVSAATPSLIEEKSPKPERSGETRVRTKYREFRHRRNVKVMKDDEDDEVLKIRLSCRQFRKKAEQQIAGSQWRKQRSKSAANLRPNVPPPSPRMGSNDDHHPDPIPRTISLRETNEEDKKFFVLSLDGGGTRCIMQTILLQRLVQVFPDLLSKFDMFAGVSGGSMNAAMLAMGLKPDLMADVQKFMAPAVFGKGKRQATLELKGLSLRRAKYSADPLLILGEELFQGQSLAKCPSRLLMITFALDNDNGHVRAWEPKVYHNIPMKKTDDPDSQPFAMRKKDLEDTPLWDHCLASSAAPTFFKSHRKHVDGGVVSNTASSAALACLISESAEQPIKPSNLHILNIGTGRIVQYLEGDDDDHDWGIIQWAPKLPGLLFAAHDTFGHQLNATILGERYHRLDTFLEKPTGMDDASSLPTLIQIAQNINLDDTIEWIRHFMYPEHESSPPIGSSKGRAAKQRKKADTMPSSPPSSLASSIPPGLTIPGHRGSQTWDSAWFNTRG